MPRHIHLDPHLAEDDLYERYRRARLRELLEALATWTQRCRPVPDNWLVGGR